MNQFTDKVAVITGAASGIGRALAEQCAREGMKVVLADIEETALSQTEKEFRDAGFEPLAVTADVSKEDDVRLLANVTQEFFGGVHLLFNNAGVGAGSMIWNSTKADWQWVMNVNLWGAIHMTQVFVPLMLQQQSDCHIVYTASQAGLESGPFNGIYRVTKHALVCFSETLYHELKIMNAPIGVSVLCPGFVNTKICDADRNRPAELANPPSGSSPQWEAVDRMMRDAVAAGMYPAELAQIAFGAIRQNQFYILPHPETKPAVKLRTENILNDRNPSFIMPQSFQKK